MELGGWVQGGARLVDGCGGPRMGVRANAEGGGQVMARPAKERSLCAL